MSVDERNGWMSFDEALEHTGRSPATLRRAIQAGKIRKSSISVPGRRPEIHLSREDLDAAFGKIVQIPSVPTRPDSDHQEQSLMSAIERLGAAQYMRGTLDQMMTRVEADKTRIQAKIDEIEKAIGDVEKSDEPDDASVPLVRKLCWTLDEARIVTGLSRPALRELVQTHEDLAIRRGRRVWIKAAGLRRVLG